MNFIIILVALLLDQIMRWFEHLRLHHWYEAPLARWALTAQRAGEPAQVLAALAPSVVPAIVLGSIGVGLVRLNPVLGFVYGVLILVLCLGPRNLTLEASAYLRARAAGDTLRARAIAALLLEKEPPADLADAGEDVAEAVLARAGDYLFCVVFWFALLGPFGAVLYRGADTLAPRAAFDVPDSVYAHWTLGLKRILAWIPLHLLAITYAVAGNFDEALTDIRRAWSETRTHFWDRGSVVLAYAGRRAVRAVAGAATDEVELIHAAVDLIWRGFIIWLTVIGLLTLLGWLF
ncbi:MAG: regulatory signaling modulator protein AmpE [Gammaproteobacteria bacterium]